MTWPRNPARSAPPVEFVDLTSGGFLRLAVATGAELARQVPDGAPGLKAVFDALVPAPETPGDE